MKMDKKKEIITKLQKCSEKMADEMGIDKVILFGSYVRGDVTRDSDIDLLVIGRKKDRDLRTKIAVRFHRTLPEKPIDVLLKTKKEIDRRLNIGDRFIKRIMDKGEVVYERDHKRVVG